MSVSVSRYAVIAAIIALGSRLGAQVTPQGGERAPERTDEWLKKPVDGKTFETFRTFFAYDSRLPLDTRVLDTTAADGIVVEHLSFESTPGVRVFALLYESAPLRG